MFTCPTCGDKFNEIEDLYQHLDDEHFDSIPKDFTPAQYLYMLKTGKDHGSCVIDKKNTKWNPSTNKYARFCENPKCKQTYIEEFKKRMIGKYGKISLLNDPEQQKKMLANRSISGKYRWSDDSEEKTYTGTYELDFLKFLDLFLNFESSDIMAPSPHTYYYEYEGQKKFYIPDFFIASLNLEVEIKDGGDNPNNHHKIQDVDKVKEHLKDQVLMSQKSFSYVKIPNKNYEPFFELLVKLKEQYKTMNKEIGETKPIFIVKESMQLNKEDLIDDIVMESYLFSDDDIYNNFDTWKKGQNNVLFITGLSGSGKSTLSEELTNKYKAKLIPLDTLSICLVKGKPLEKSNEAYNDYINEYIIQYKNVPTIKWTDYEKSKIETEKFMDWILPKLKIKSDELFIIEGSHIYAALSDMIDYFRDKPIIIKGTSLSTSILRRHIRRLGWKKKGNVISNSLDSILKELRAFPHMLQYSEELDEWKLNVLKNNMKVNSKKIYHGSSIQNLKTIDPYISRSYSDKGPIVFGSAKEEFAACFCIKWTDDELSLGTTSNKNHIDVTEDSLIGVSLWLKHYNFNFNQPCSIYEVENKNFNYLRHDKDLEVYTTEPVNVIKEHKFNSFFEVIDKFNIEIYDKNTKQKIDVKDLKNTNVLENAFITKNLGKLLDYRIKMLNSVSSFDELKKDLTGLCNDSTTEDDIKFLKTDIKQCKSYLNTVSGSSPEMKDAVTKFKSWLDKEYTNMLNDKAKTFKKVNKQEEKNFMTGSLNTEKHYGEKMYKKFKLDLVKSWKNDTGLEIIHREPVKEVLENMWNNWKQMSFEKRNASDKKSRELFGIPNKQHYEKLINEFDKFK